MTDLPLPSRTMWIRIVHTSLQKYRLTNTSHKKIIIIAQVEPPPQIKVRHTLHSCTSTKTHSRSIAETHLYIERSPALQYKKVWKRAFESVTDQQAVNCSVQEHLRRGYCTELGIDSSRPALRNGPRAHETRNIAHSVFYISSSSRD